MNMCKLLAQLILLLALPVMSEAEVPKDVQGSESAPRPSSESVPPGAHPIETFPEKQTEAVDTQSDAYAICLRATKRFDEQERAKGNTKVEITSLSTACKEELKPAAYWLCMDKEARGQVDFNTAHGRCAKQTNISK